MIEYSKKVMGHFFHPKNMGTIKNPDGVGRVGNPICVVPETLVQTNDEMVEISKIRKGQKVLGHDGKYHKIKKVHHRVCKGKIFSLRVHNLGQVMMTPDHLVLALKTSQYPYKMRALEEKKCYIDWYHLEGLQKGDTIIYPIPKETKDVRSMRLGIEKPFWDFKSRELPGEIKVNNDFLKLVGYYLSEGYVRTDKCKGTVGFTFGSHEGIYIQDTILIMKRIFGLSPVIYKSAHNSTNLFYYSARLARFFKKNFGKGALEKQLPHWIMQLPTKKQWYLLSGLWRGDGHIDEKHQRAKYVTISKKLAYQLRNLFLRQKIIHSFTIGRAYGIHKKSYCFYIQHDPSLQQIAKMMGKEFKIKARSYNPHKSWFDANYYYTTISEIKPIDYSGLVYNLEVKDSRSYVSASATLHNCGDVMELQIKVEKKDGKEYIKDIKFQSFGCGAAIATSSMITVMVKGKTLEQALKITRQDVSKELGGLPPIKEHCSNLAAEGLLAAIEDYRKKKK